MRAVGSGQRLAAFIGVTRSEGATLAKVAPLIFRSPDSRRGRNIESVPTGATWEGREPIAPTRGFNGRAPDDARHQDGDNVGTPRGSKKAMVDAFLEWMQAMVKHLPAAEPKLGKVTVTKGTLELRLPREPRMLRGKVSAPLSLLTGVFMELDVAATTRVYTQSTGSANAVLALLRGEGAPQERYLELLRATKESGEEDEARLGMLLAKDVYDPHDRKHPLFAELFPALPAAARKPAVAGSEAAFLERRLREGLGRSPVDALLLALDLNEHLSGAISDVGSQKARLAKLLGAVDRAIPALAAHPELATRDIVRLVRQQLGSALAYRYEQA